MDEDETDDVSLLDLGTDTVNALVGRDEPVNPDEFSAQLENNVLKDQVRAVVRRYGEDGISRSVVADILDVTEETAGKHLDDLVNLREVYKQKVNKQMYLYYPNGKPLHGIGTRRIKSDDNDLVFEFQLAQGKHDQLYFHIKEKRFSVLEGERTEGAIMFPLNQLDEFFSEMNSLASEVERE